MEWLGFRFLTTGNGVELRNVVSEVTTGSRGVSHHTAPADTESLCLFVIADISSAWWKPATGRALTVLTWCGSYIYRTTRGSYSSSHQAG